MSLKETVQALALSASLASPDVLANEQKPVTEELAKFRNIVSLTVESKNNPSVVDGKLASLEQKVGANNPFELQKVEGVQVADSGLITNDASPANFIGEESKSGLKLPSNYSKAQVGNAELAVWKDGSGKINVTVTKEDSTGGTDDFAFTSKIGSDNYYIYSTPDMQIMAKKVTEEEAGILLSCDMDRSGVLNGKKEGKCETKYTTDKLDKSIADSEKSIADSEKSIADSEKSIADLDKKIDKVKKEIKAKIN